MASDSGSTWSQRSKAVASDGVVNDRFEWSVSIYGNIAVIGFLHRECIKLYTSYLNEGGSMSNDNR